LVFVDGWRSARLACTCESQCGKAKQSPESCGSGNRLCARSPHLTSPHLAADYLVGSLDATAEDYTDASLWGDGSLIGRSLILVETELGGAVVAQGNREIAVRK
jgi:hypothetical protein